MEILKRMLAKRREERKDEIQRMAGELFQVAESDGKLWLTFNGNLVCPCGMLNVSPVDAVEKMRELYVNRRCGL